jgi:CRP-like cAMP-binding protein
MERPDILSVYREQIRHMITLDEEEWQIFKSFLKVKRLKKNEHLMENGKVCRDLSFIVKGAVRFCSLVDGDEITGYFCFENNFVTALKSYLTGEPCIYDIKALEETILVNISKKARASMLSHSLLSCKIERFGRLVSESFNILFEDRLKSFIVKTPEERYLDLLKCNKDIVQRIPVQYIAQFIGITPVSLSRIKKRILKAAVSHDIIAPVLS